MRRIAHVLADRGLDVSYLAHPRGLPTELDWANRLHLPLQFLYGLRREQGDGGEAPIP